MSVRKFPVIYLTGGTYPSDSCPWLNNNIKTETDSCYHSYLCAFWSFKDVTNELHACVYPDSYKKLTKHVFCAMMRDTFKLWSKISHSSNSFLPLWYLITRMQIQLIVRNNNPWIFFLIWFFIVANITSPYNAKTNHYRWK